MQNLRFIAIASMSRFEYLYSAEGVVANKSKMFWYDNEFSRVCIELLEFEYNTWLSKLCIKAIRHNIVAPGYCYLKLRNTIHYLKAW